MTKRRAFDQAEHDRSRKGVKSLRDFGLFETPEGPEPDLRTPAPSAPGSETSALAADSVDTRAESRKVLLWFAAQSQPRTRHECADALYSHLGSGAVGPACARINELVTLGCLEEVGRQGRRATIAITGRGSAKANLLARVA